MKIAIDARWIFPSMSGIGVYTRELIRQFAILDRANEYLILFQDPVLQTRIAGETGFNLASNFHSILVPYGLFSIANQLRLPALLRREGVDVYHSTNYMIPLLAFRRCIRGRMAGVVTIHDVIPLIFHDHAPRSRKSRMLPVYAALMRSIGARVDRIITVSNTSRLDVIQHLRIPLTATDKVQVVYNGVSEQFRPATAAGNRDPAQPRTVLYVGRADPYKNLVVLVEAFARLRSAHGFPVRLRLIGATDPRYPEAPARARELGLDNALEWSQVLPPDALVDAYRKADLLVMPSQYEGFGLPVAEAMACGVPVICGDCGALREVGGLAATFVPPRDPVALAQAMQAILSDPALAAAMAQRGLIQSAKFSWKTSAEATLAVYRQAVSAKT